MRVRALIFDLDGTLGDTLPVCYAAYREVLLKYLARDFSDQAIQKLFGPSEEGIFRKLVPDDWLAAQQAYLSAYQRLHPQLGRKIAGIESLLEGLRRNRIRTAVVTGKGSESARLSLEALGLTAYFDVVEAGSAHVVATQPIAPGAQRPLRSGSCAGRISTIFSQESRSSLRAIPMAQPSFGRPSPKDGSE